MVYEPRALEAALAAVVGDEPALIAELRGAFVEGAHAHLAAMQSAVDLADWQSAARRLHGLSASFGALRVMKAANAAASTSAIDQKLTRAIERAIVASAR